MSKEKRLPEIIIKDFMTPNPVCIKPEDTIREVARIFSDKKIDGAPVVDVKGNLVGIFTKSHLLRAVSSRKDLDSPVKCLMKRDVVTIKETDTPEDGWSLGWTKKVGRLPVVNEEGRLTGMWTRTNLVRAFEKKALDTINTLNAVLQYAHNGIIAIDRRGIVITFNKAAGKIVGISPEEALGKPIEEILPNTKLLEVLKTGESQFSQKHKINKTTVLTNRTPIVAEDGAIIGAMAVFQDLSEIESVSAELEIVKNLNHELDAIFESSYDGIVIANGQGVLIKINKAYERITGLEAKKLIGRSVYDLVKEGVISESATAKVLERRKEVTIFQKIKTGKEMLVTGSPIFDHKTGEIKYVISNCRDLTELNELQRKLDETAQLSQKYYSEVQRLRAQQLEVENILAKSVPMKKILELAMKVAEVDCNVLILGESGVGKEIIAKLIHKHGPRAEGPFIKVNCGAVPENLLESEFFGYEGGAFTGAKKEGKPGTFELAEGGTLFLDEIGELPLSLQVKLLNVLQDREYTRLGGTKPIKVDVRLIAATNKDLKAEVEKGNFRLDLYYRLDVINIRVPPLRERKDDILPLLLFFLNNYNHKYRQNKKLTSEVIDLFYNYNWPGNVRELENIVERIVVTGETDYITVDSVPEYIRKAGSGLYGIMKFQDERRKLESLYNQYQSTRKVASILGVNQSTVVRKMKKYNISARKR